jgi:lipopolysaccharide biosynthesis glycosyltransferase
MKIAFTTVLDDKYLPGFLITFNSILRCSKNFNYDVIILEWGDLSDENKQVIQSLYDKVQFRFVDKELYKEHSYDETHRIWTYNCNYRFDIFTFVEYDRVVFFDCDMIFQIDVSELLEYDVDFGACAAQIGGVQQINRELGFDGGLMSVGKKYLNKETRAELLKIAELPAPYEKNLNSTKWVSDEPILNTYFLDKMTWLPDKFNFLIAKLDNVIINTPNNYQFAGHNKPWHSNILSEQFCPHVIESISNTTSGFYITKIVLAKLLRLFNKEMQNLKEKQIDIYK